MCEANRGSCSATKSHFALFKSMSLMTACLQVTCHSQFRRELLIAGTSAHHGRSGWSLDCTMLRPTTCCDYLGVIHDEVALASSRTAVRCSTRCGWLQIEAPGRASRFGCAA